MLICGDIGNSGISLAGWAGAEACTAPVWRIEVDRAADLEQLVGLAGTARCSWHLVSVSRPRLQMLVDWLEANRPADSWRELTAEDLPIRTAVDQPARTGTDRLVAGWAAWRRAGGPVIVVDAGTAVTVDLVDGEGVFQGGNIFPGASACLAALAAGTDQLPEIRASTPPCSPIGRNTVDAMLSGVMRMQAGGIQRLVDDLRQAACSPSIPVVCTGGGMIPLRDLLPADYRQVPWLVVDGVCQIVSEAG